MTGGCQKPGRLEGEEGVWMLLGLNQTDAAHSKHAAPAAALAGTPSVSVLWLSKEIEPIRLTD